MRMNQNLTEASEKLRDDFGENGVISTLLHIVRHYQEGFENKSKVATLVLRLVMNLKLRNCPVFRLLGDRSKQ